MEPAAIREANETKNIIEILSEPKVKVLGYYNLKVIDKL